ncbi:MAG: molybdopterin molybdotransferase MoeA, partial [Gammaproteobacteria bacterium]|nr:molybdopterin molybdotransferase MoeA [Gammaproteobacteria bacterium]
MSSLMPIDEALASVLESAVPVAETSRVPLSASSGRILGVSVTSAINVPPADNSAMDGYAMDAADTDLVSGGTYRVSDRIPAGSRGQPLEAGTLVRIFTGGEIPPGANAVVMQENTREAGTDRVALLGKPEVGQNVREKGQDIRQGQQILVAGKRLTPQDIGLLASIGCDEVEVYRPLRVGILATGNELVDPPKPLGPGQIYNSNRFSLASLVSNLGMEPCYFG